MSRSIYTRRQTLAQQLRSSLGSDFTVIASPDHPLVMRSVDVLVGGNGILTAFVMSNNAEIRHPYLLDARVLLNKVALPLGTKFVYVAKSHEGQLLARTREYFETVTELDRTLPADVAQLASEVRPGKEDENEAELRHQSLSRFSNTFRLARVLQSSKNRGQEGFWREADHDDHSISLHGVEATYIDQTATSRLVTQLTLNGVSRWFYHDHNQSQPIPTNEPAAVAFIPEFTAYPGDPEKLLRAAAFAGWVMAPRRSIRSPEEVAKLTSRHARAK